MNDTPIYKNIEINNYEVMIILLKYNCDYNISKIIEILLYMFAKK